MTIELQMLAWAVVLGLVHLLLDGALKTRQRGLKWNVGARDADVPPLTGVAARVNRAWGNFLETFPFFAAAVLAVEAAGRGSADTALGAQLYFWARVAYIPEEDGPPEIALMRSGETDEEAVAAAEAAAWQAEGRAAQ